MEFKEIHISARMFTQLLAGMAVKVVEEDEAETWVLVLEEMPADKLLDALAEGISKRQSRDEWTYVVRGEPDY